MSLNNREVIILGGGVAGLALSRALALRGAHVRLFEQAPSITEVGAGIQISPNGAVVLQALGLGAALEVASLKAEAVELRDGFNARLVTRLEVAKLRPDAGWRFIHRADLIDILLKGAVEAGVDIRLNQRVDSVDLAGESPVVLLEDGTRVQADLLIGADGLHSATRRALNGDAKPFFTRQIAWRAVLPCAPSEPNVAEVHMGHGRHLVSYPLRGGHLRNIVAVEERDAWADEGWSMRDDPDNLRKAFQSFSPRVTSWLDQVEDVWLWGLFRHPVAKVWQKTMSKGQVALVGDAAHPTLPFLAQGANMALEDIYSLTKALENNALEQWQITRAPRCANIVEAANRNAKAYHLSGPIRPLAHMIMRLGGKVAPNMALSRFDWIYDHNVTL